MLLESSPILSIGNGLGYTDSRRNGEVSEVIPVDMERPPVEEGELRDFRDEFKELCEFLESLSCDVKVIVCDRSCWEEEHDDSS